MASLLTLDASVFVAACRRHEHGHVASRALLQSLQATGTPLIEPAILPVEVATALRRADGDEGAARRVAESIMVLPELTLVPVDSRFVRRVLVSTLEYGLRGADALYAAVALQYGTRLVTLDAEQLGRSPDSIQACTPADVASGAR